ncbi:MAG TPA: translation initiation factor IF-2 [Candidatus Magasanikbacteria bacterium]|nr:translation initiation factor IF-2 [Candidatus Magasanikbacteria bacterium]
MNVTELARTLRTNAKELLEILPQYGFDVGLKAVKIDDKVAQKITRQWKYIKKNLDDRRRQEAELKKQKEKELRRQMGQKITLPNLITVRDFAEKMNLPLVQVIMELMKNGILANQNQSLDFETASIIANELGFTAEREAVSKEDVKKEQKREQALEVAFSDKEHKHPRSPVIVVMGHVDHGKTKLLDTIRETNVIDTESGGITQHIGAYQTIWKDPKNGSTRALTFIDTPGHEAFSVMRSRGAKVADIAIMLVAADDGVKPQTEEVISIIKAAKLPFVVAINKIDKEGADVARVKSDLSARGIICEEWGGDVPMVEVSAKQKLNIDKLLDVILLVADMNADKIMADPEAPAVGTIIESHVDKGMGPVATVLVQSGTLRRGEPLVVNGEIYGKVRVMKDYRGRTIESAPPSTPAQIVGFKVAPEVGDILDVGRAATSEDINIKEKKLKQTGAERHTIITTTKENEDEEDKKTINLLIKADVLGSLEAIVGSLEKIKHDEVGVRIIGKGLGNITEDDVKKAEAGHGIVIGFHVNATPVAEQFLRERGVEFRKYDIIYDLLNWVKADLEKMLESEKIVTELGRLKVMGIFRTEKGSMTVGGRVEAGKLKRDAFVRIMHDGVNIGVGKVVSCQSGKQDVKEIPEGSEGGLRVETKVKIMMDDVLEIYTEESKARKIVFL